MALLPQLAAYALKVVLFLQLQKQKFDRLENGNRVRELDFRSAIPGTGNILILPYFIDKTEN